MVRIVASSISGVRAATHGLATCFPDCSAFTMDMFIRLVKVRLRYATNLYSTWKSGSFSVASPARSLKLNGYPSSLLIRNHRISNSPNIAQRAEF